MTTEELFNGTDFQIWEKQPQYIQLSQQPIPPVINLNKTYVPKYNINPIDGRGYQLTVEPQDYAPTCVISSNREASRIATAANDGFWCNQATEEMYGRVRNTERNDPTISKYITTMGAHPTQAARIMTKQGWVLRAKYPQADLQYFNPKTTKIWENTPPPTLPIKAKNKDIYKITTMDGITRSIMAKRPVVFQVPWAWVRNDNKGIIQPVNLGGWHSMSIFGLANNTQGLSGLYYMLLNTFRLSIMSGYDNPLCSGRGSGLYQFNTLDQTQILNGFCSSVGPLVKV